MTPGFSIVVERMSPAFSVGAGSGYCIRSTEISYDLGLETHIFWHLVCAQSVCYPEDSPTAFQIWRALVRGFQWSPPPRPLLRGAFDRVACMRKQRKIAGVSRDMPIRIDDTSHGQGKEAATTSASARATSPPLPSSQQPHDQREDKERPRRDDTDDGNAGGGGGGVPRQPGTSLDQAISCVPSERSANPISRPTNKHFFGDFKAACKVQPPPVVTRSSYIWPSCKFLPRFVQFKCVLPYIAPQPMMPLVTVSWPPGPP